MEDKIKVIFRGHVMRKMYEFEDGRSVRSMYYYEPYIYETEQHIDFEKFHECEINKPPFEKNEKVFITDLNLEVNIESRMRSTNDEYVYDTTHILRVIEDDLTVEGKKKKEEKLARELIMYNAWKNPKPKPKVMTKTKKWYQFWK